MNMSMRNISRWKSINLVIILIIAIHSDFVNCGENEKWFVSVCDEDVFPKQNARYLGLDLKHIQKRWLVPAELTVFNETINFSLTIFEPKCRAGYTRYLDLKSDNVEPNHSQTQHFYPNGYFQFGRHIYAPDEYCIEEFVYESSNHFDVKMKFCKPDCAPGRNRACIKKCCPLYKIFRGEPGEPGKPFCEDLPPGSIQFSPPFYHDIYHKVEDNSGGDEIQDASSPFSPERPLPHFKYQHPKTFKDHCKDQIVVPLPTSEVSAKLLTERYNGITIHGAPPFRLRSDGAVMYKSLENKCDMLHYKWDHYCVDGMRGALVEDLDSPFNNTEEEYISFQCQVPEKDEKKDRFLSSIIGSLLLITSIFPLITSIVYMLLWKKQNVYGWAIASESGSLFFMYLFQGTAHIIGVTAREAALNTFYCKLIAVLSHFFGLSTFTWLTVMSCDLWLTFRSVVPMNQRLQGVPRYLKYSAFAWGIPTVIVTVGILMDFVISRTNDCSFHAVPAYGQRSCWIVESSLGEYLYYPALLLICINIGLFTATCVKLCMYGKGPGARSRRNDAFGECFSRFTKLFCVMGISWIFEIVSWYVDGLGYVWYWNIFDILNILRAIFVFIIYVCKKDIIHQLEEVYPFSKRIFRPFSRLILRKCSDELSVESTVFSAAATNAPSSPGIPLKVVNKHATTNNRLDNPKPK